MIVLQGLALSLLSKWHALPILFAILFLPFAAHWPQQTIVLDGIGFYSLAMGAMLASFAGSLRPGHEPLVSTLARHVHGTLRDDVARYTRRVTMFWSFFFAIALLLPAALFLWGPSGGWRWPMTGGTIAAAVFAMTVEAFLRRIVIRNFDHVSLRTTITAFRDFRPASRQKEAADA